MTNHYLLECKRYLLNAYPSFVTSSSPKPLKGVIPIFIFHRTAPITFEEKLIFLKENRYNTITIEDLYRFLKVGSLVPEKSVLFTFDDGDSSIYHVAYPLLKKYGFCATIFLCPQYIQEEPLPFNHNKKSWLGWKEIEEMQKSRLVDTQSHTLNHERIFTHPRIIDFYRDNMFVDELWLDIPTIFENGRYTKELLIGTPIYTIHSRMEGYPRYFDSPTVRKRCIENRDKLFLKWKARYWIREFRNETRFESPEEQRLDILNNLLQSKKIIEQRLNKEVHHLAYPYGRGSEIAIECSKEAGFKTNLWGPIYNCPSTNRNTNPFLIPRLKDDFIFRLPGKGRQSLSGVILYKYRRRRLSRDIY